MEDRELRYNNLCLTNFTCIFIITTVIFKCLLLPKSNFKHDNLQRKTFHNYKQTEHNLLGHDSAYKSTMVNKNLSKSYK